MTRVWKKVPRVTSVCACGCGVSITGTARKRYATPYCKYKAYLERKKDPEFIPDPRFDPTKSKQSQVIPFTLGEKPESTLYSWWKERWKDDKDVSSTVKAR